MTRPNCKIVCSRSHVRVVVVGALFLASLLRPAPAGAWGDKGHTMINRLAAEGMPADTPSFFRRAVERLAYLGPEPDRWRTAQRGEGTDVAILNQDAAPEHFLDMEYVAGITLPRGRYDYLRAMLEQGIVKGNVKLETAGFLPWRVAELAQMLRREWALWRAAPTGTRADRERKKQIEENILHVAGVLGHYVGDGGNPHHTTWHYNGWVETLEPNPEGFTTARGIHARFETEFVDAAVEITDVRPLVAAPRPVGDFFDETLTYLRGSFALLRDLYRLDKRNAFLKAPENAAANTEGQRFVAQRLAVAASMLRDLWMTAMRG